VAVVAGDRDVRRHLADCAGLRVVQEIEIDPLGGIGRRAAEGRSEIEARSPQVRSSSVRRGILKAGVGPVETLLEGVGHD
jgi:hypothetical protein